MGILSSQWLGPIVVLTVGFAGEASGQIKNVELTPFAAAFIPTKTLGRTRVPGNDGTPISLLGEMTASGGFGGRITVDGGGRFGLEGTLFTIKSNVQAIFGPLASTYDARLTAGSLKTVFRTTDGTSGIDFKLTAGVTGMNHTGRAFRLTTDQFDLAGVVGSGLHIDLSPQVTLRIDGEVHIYDWSAGPTFQRKRQADVLMSAGLGLKMNR